MARTWQDGFEKRHPGTTSLNWGGYWFAGSEVDITDTEAYEDMGYSLHLGDSALTIYRYTVMPSAQAPIAYMRIMLKAVGITGGGQFDAYFSIYDDQEGVLVYILPCTSEYHDGSAHDLGYVVGEGWEMWEFYATIDNPGDVIIRHNGIPGDDIILSFDTSGETNIGGFEFIIMSGSGIDFYVDDLAYNDTVDAGRGNDSWCGLGKIVRYNSVGVGSNEDFTPEPGAGEDNWQNVDDGEQDGDTTYVHSTTVGHIDTHITEDLPPGWTPKEGCVRVTWLAELSAAGSGSIAPYIVDGGDSVLGTAQALTTSWTYFHEMMAVSPDLSEWTRALFNAAEFGFRLDS